MKERVSPPRGTSGVAGLAFFALAVASTLSASPAAPSSIERSNENARLLLEMQARFAPESVSFLGLAGFDEQIFDLNPDRTRRSIEATEGVVAELKKRLTAEKDPLVRQDLEILIQSGEEAIEGTRLSEKLELPYFNLVGTVFHGLRSLLDEQVSPDRRGKALIRLKKYSGLLPGHKPIAELARDRIRERLSSPGLLAPVREELERDLTNAPSYLDGIAKLFQKYQIAGYEEPYEALRRQLEEYHAFLRRDVLPRARTDFRLPRELYDFTLKRVGVDMPVGDLVSRAQVAFREIQNEMQALAPLVARENGLSAADYREVIREMKKRQVAGDAILPLYEKRIRELEDRIRRESIVSLPQRPMRIRLATEAESAATPAPNMRPPRLIGNTGEMGEFVLPLRIAAGGTSLQYDDFTFEAASWTLAVHEGRPGHELQFAALVENGVSTARAVFAFNSVNVEGWALYAEAEMKPYLPLDGQLISLQHRLMRAARAYLDPGLQLGTITREEATRILREEVVLSEAMALQEVQRYTFRSPGQATAYFCGYTRLMELRTEAERAMGKSFDRKVYHDFLLAQGLLPPSLLRRAVREVFVPKPGAR